MQHFKELGFIYVTLDLQGYRTGSMNEVLSATEKEGYLQPVPAAGPGAASTRLTPEAAQGGSV